MMGCIIYGCIISHCIITVLMLTTGQQRATLRLAAAAAAAGRYITSLWGSEVRVATLQWNHRQCSEVNLPYCS